MRHQIIINTFSHKRIDHSYSYITHSAATYKTQSTNIYMKVKAPKRTKCNFIKNIPQSTLVLKQNYFYNTKTINKSSETKKNPPLNDFN